MNFSNQSGLKINKNAFIVNDILHNVALRIHHTISQHYMNLLEQRYTKHGPCLDKKMLGPGIDVTLLFTRLVMQKSVCGLLNLSMTIYHEYASDHEKFHESASCVSFEEGSDAD